MKMGTETLEECRTKYDAWLEVDCDALRSNIKTVRSIIGENVKILAVIKANAYGHGMVEVAGVLEPEVDYFGIASVNEGIELREAGVLSPLLVLGAASGINYEEAIRNKMALTVSDISQAVQIDKTAAETGENAEVQVKVDTGMGRLGINYEESLEQITEMSRLENIEITGIFTHFASADSDGKYTSRQIESFSKLLKALSERRISCGFVHAANSAGLLGFSTSHFNMVRPGIIMFGINPVTGTAHSAGSVPPVNKEAGLYAKLRFTPAISLRARVAHIKEINAGKSVSYGRQFVASRKTKVAVLPVGYAHGYPFSMSGKGQVMINGELCRVAGRVTMDFTIVEIGDNETAVGDEAVLIDGRLSDKLSPEHIADVAGTIPYEILTGLSPKLKRIYINK